MSDLEQSTLNVTSGLAKNDFSLDPRTATELLNMLAEYADIIPFAGHDVATWKSFWMGAYTPEILRQLYDNPSLADKKLAVQQAFMLALLKILETPRTLLNTLPARHRSLYYRDLLGFTPRAPRPDTVAVCFRLQKGAALYQLPKGSLLDGGHDAAGNSLSYQTDDNLLISEQQLDGLFWTRQAAGGWKQCTAIDTRKGIALPVEGLRLFTATDNETGWTVAQAHEALYLGFSGTSAQDTLSVYWSVRASARLDLRWWYYSKNDQWRALDDVVQDETAGFSVSNLWRVRLPDDIQPGGEGLEASLYWIKATPAEGRTLSSTEMPRLKAVLANAMTATLSVNKEIDDSHFTRALPPDTISRLVTPVAAISRVEQPLPSSGGQPRETDQAMLQRAATRIAHRQRAITWQNMRSLLMEQYPQIYDVRFPDIEKLGHFPASDIQTLMIIPDNRYCDNDDLLRPALSSGRLAKMAQWLRQYTSLWATPALRNPKYIDVKARYRVAFVAGIHPDYGYRDLAMQLQLAFMPWGNDQRRAVTLGNKVDYYQLLATLQKSPLVQSVRSLVLSHDVTDDTGKKTTQQTQHTVTASDDEVLILCPEGERDV